jgi:hypothetical protein
VLDEMEPVPEDDPFDVAADAVLAAARSRHVYSPVPLRSQPQSLAPAPFTAAAAPQNRSLDLDATMGGTFTAETSLDLFRYAEEQAAHQLASISAVCKKVARADDALRARRAAESPAAPPEASAAPTVALPASVELDARAHRAPRALPPRPPKREPAMAPSVTAPAAAPTLAAKPTSARLAAAVTETRRAASDAGPNPGPCGRVGGDARPRHVPVRPPGLDSTLMWRPDGDTPNTRRDSESVARSGAAQRQVAGGKRVASRQREQEERMQERKLEASLDRLDTKLALYRARRNAGPDSDTASCLSAVSRAHSTVSAPPRVQSVQRLRSATREAARQQGWYGDQPPCKRHGLLSCKLCAEEALRPPAHKPAVKAAVVLPPPPPPGRFRSAHPHNRTQVCSYTSARQPGGASLCAGRGQGTVARALQAARAERQPECLPRAPSPADAGLPQGIPAWPCGMDRHPYMTPLAAEQPGMYASVPVPTSATGWPPLGLHMGPQLLTTYQPAYPRSLNGPPLGLGPAGLAPLQPFPAPLINSHLNEGRGPSSKAHAQKAAGPGGTVKVVAPNSQSLLFGDEYSGIASRA